MSIINKNTVNDKSIYDVTSFLLTVIHLKRLGRLKFPLYAPFQELIRRHQEI